MASLPPPPPSVACSVTLQARWRGENPGSSQEASAQTWRHCQRSPTLCWQPTAGPRYLHPCKAGLGSAQRVSKGFTALKPILTGLQKPPSVKGEGGGWPKGNKRAAPGSDRRTVLQELGEQSWPGHHSSRTQASISTASTSSRADKAPAQLHKVLGRGYQAFQGRRLSLQMGSKA